MSFNRQLYLFFNLIFLFLFFYVEISFSTENNSSEFPEEIKEKIFDHFKDDLEMLFSLSMVSTVLRAQTERRFELTKKNELFKRITSLDSTFKEIQQSQKYFTLSYRNLRPEKLKSFQYVLPLCQTLPHIESLCFTGNFDEDNPLSPRNLKKWNKRETVREVALSRTRMSYPHESVVSESMKFALENNNRPYAQLRFEEKLIR